MARSDDGNGVLRTSRSHSGPSGADALSSSAGPGSTLGLLRSRDAIISRLGKQIEAFVERPEREVLGCLVLRRRIPVSSIISRFVKALLEVVTPFGLRKYGAVNGLLNLLRLFPLQIASIDDVAVLGAESAQSFIGTPATQLLIELLPDWGVGVHFSHLVH